MDHDSCEIVVVQNCSIIWYDENLNESDENIQHPLTRLREMSKSVYLFNKAKQCIDFLFDNEHEQTLLITSQSLAHELIPAIHFISSLSRIYIISDKQHQHEQWIKTWPKIRGIYTTIESICKNLQVIEDECHDDSELLGCTSLLEDVTNSNKDRLEPSFIYSKLLIKTLRTMTYDEQSKQALVNYVRVNLPHATSVRRIIDEFELEYCSNKAIWWFDRECFIYPMINQALRLLQTDVIVLMGFFIRDLCNQIECLHKEQIDQYHGQLFTVYRGQRLSTTDFEWLKTNQGGLISFNTFLSTCVERDVSLIIALSATDAIDMYGIFFVISIDPNLNCTSFANIEKLSYFSSEGPVLFTPHTVFRIGEIENMDAQERLFRVSLTLTADEDRELTALSNSLEKRMVGLTDVQRISDLLLYMGQPRTVEELNSKLLTATPNKSEQAWEPHYYMETAYMLMGNYERAIQHLKCAFSLSTGIIFEQQPKLVSMYITSGNVYRLLGEYSKALNLLQSISLASPVQYADVFNGIGLVYCDMGNYPKALLYCKKALAIQRKVSRKNFVDVSASYSNIAVIYQKMSRYSEALALHAKVLAMRQRLLPDQHPDLASTYDNIGSTYRQMHEYSKALSYQEKALDLRKRILPDQHPDLASTYDNMGSTYRQMHEYSKALSFQQKALEIQQKSMPSPHPAIASSYHNIGEVYHQLKEHSKALSFNEKALDMRQHILPVDHPDMASSLHNIGLVYLSLNNQSKAMHFLEKAFNIRRNIFPPDHSDLMASRNVMNALQYNTRRYLEAMTVW